jgi:hypothetical protein
MLIEVVMILQSIKRLHELVGLSLNEKIVDFCEKVGKRNEMKLK